MRQDWKFLIFYSSNPIYFENVVTEISQIMARSRDWDELQWVWTEWRRRSGSQIKELYQQLVDLNNEAARINSK